MKPASFIRILPFIGLASCMAPKAILVEDGASVPPAQEVDPAPTKSKSNVRRFGFGVGYATEFPDDQKPVVTNISPPIGETPAPPKKSWFSFLKPKDPPKAIVVADAAPNKARQRPEVVDAPLKLPDDPPTDDSGLRLPDMLTMPKKGEFESSNPAAQKTGGGAGVVTVRPPTDPPSRPKPKDPPPKP